MIEITAWWAGHQLCHYTVHTKEDAYLVIDEISDDFYRGKIKLVSCGVVFYPDVLCIDAMTGGKFLIQKDLKK